MLFGAGTALSWGLGSWLAGDAEGPLSIGLWETIDAAAYPDCRATVETYLQRALAPVGRDVEVSASETPLSFAADDRTVERRAWPARVVAGLAGLGPIEPASDVNLLLTDGDRTGSTAGYAYPHVAAVPGARHLAEMPVHDPATTVVDASTPAMVTQLLLHEVGHALGLDHGHGSVTRDATATTASPMVSGYAWADEAVRRRVLRGRQCRGEDVGHATGERRVSLQYSPCAVAALRAYRGGLPV